MRNIIERSGRGVIVLLCALVFQFMLIAPAFCVAIPIANYSFEDPVLNIGPGWNDASPIFWTQNVGIPGWICSDNNFSGVILGAGTATDGSNAAWVQGPNSISQILLATLQPDYDYTLSLSLGHRSGFTLGPRIQLLAGTAILLDSYPAIPAQGANSIVTFLYQSGSVVPVGQNLQVRLINDDNIGVQSHFDNVALDGSSRGPINSAVPEPAFLSLSAIAAVAWFFRKNKYL